jgi:hypothetical protein
MDGDASMKNLTVAWLQSRNACRSGLSWFVESGERDTRKFVMLAVNANRADYAHWVLTQLMDREQHVRYAIMAARLLLHRYETAHPHDSRVRSVIELAQLLIDTYGRTGLAYDDVTSVYATESLAYRAGASTSDPDARLAARTAARAVRALAVRDTAGHACKTAIRAAGKDCAVVHMRIVEYGLELLNL